MASTRFDRLVETAQMHVRAVETFMQKAATEGRDLTAAEEQKLQRHVDLGREAAEGARQAKADAATMKAISALGAGLGLDDDYAVGEVDSAGRRTSATSTAPRGKAEWAATVAKTLVERARATGVKALTTGSVDVPAPLLADVAAMPQPPTRITDLIGRQAITGKTYSYLRQVVRTNAAAPVADLAQKPVSVFTAQEIDGTAKVIAHLSEPFPERFMTDYAALSNWLGSEMWAGVVAAVEQQIVNGDGLGENFTGILATSGTLAVPYAIDILTTLRRGLTALQLQDETPTAWVLHPSDLETIDLMKEVTGGGFLVGGSSPAASNVFGNLPKVASHAVPAGTALLADWSQAALVVREDVRLDTDKSGELFRTNAVQLRAEGRFDVAVLRPRAFAVIDLAA